MGLADAAAAARRLGEMDELEQFLRSASSPGALAEVDLEQAREYLGDDGARSLDRLARLAKELEAAGLIEQREGRYELTALGIRRIGQRALSDLFSKLAKDRLGGHRNTFVGTGHEPEGQTKPYEFGDPFTFDIQRTVHNAVRRAGDRHPGAPVPDDFEISRTEHLTRASTVLMVDLSLSMPMRDNFLAAKKVAIALHTLISTQFPRDFLGLVGFSEVAREIKAEELPEVSWDFVYGTNMQHGLLLSRRLLAHRPGTKQIIMITDGEPTAHLVPDAGGDGHEVFFHYPPVAETVHATLGRGGPVHQGGHHHQHLHARPRPLPAGIRGEDDAAQPGPRLLHVARDARRLRARRLPRAPPHQSTAPPAAAPEPADAPLPPPPQPADDDRRSRPVPFGRLHAACVVSRCHAKW